MNNIQADWGARYMYIRFFDSLLLGRLTIDGYGFSWFNPSPLLVVRALFCVFFFPYLYRFSLTCNCNGSVKCVGGGGVKAFAEASAKNVNFFNMLPEEESLN